MFLIHQPTEERIQDFIAAQGELPFSYSEVGASRHGAVSSYPVNHYRVRLGAGAEVFRRAQHTLHSWGMYDLSWTHLCWPSVPIREGAVVAVLAYHFGFWSLNACRIIYTLEESGPVERCGFAFGTLPDHSEQGEERFVVEWERASDAVWYELFAFARPKHVLAKLGYSAARFIQRRFAVESGQAMISLVTTSGT